LGKPRTFVIQGVHHPRGRRPGNPDVHQVVASERDGGEDVSVIVKEKCQSCAGKQCVRIWETRNTYPLKLLSHFFAPDSVTPKTTPRELPTHTVPFASITGEAYTKESNVVCRKRHVAPMVGKKSLEGW
jgi:hypothetical protein